MSCRSRIIAWIAGGLAGLIVILAITAILAVRTNWFREYVRGKIVSTAEQSTGGRVEVGSFDFDWTHLRATLHNFVLRGTEPAGQPPLFQASLIQLDLKLFSGLEHLIDLASLRVEQPQANVIVFSDGRTNVPSPRVKSNSGKSGLETVVDLKIGRFDLEHGSFAFNAQKTAFEAKGENLRAQLFYNSSNPSYKGQIDIDPLYLDSGHNAPVNLKIALPIVLEKDAIRVSNASITSPRSQVTVSASVSHMASPNISGHVNAKVNLEEATQAAGISLPIVTGDNLPDSVTADLAADMNGNTIRISTARVSLGKSNLEASGTLHDPSGKGAVQFKTSLALNELGRLFRVQAQPEGVLRADGNAKLVGQSGYEVTARINGQDLAFREGARQFTNIGVSGVLSANQQNIRLNNFRLAALGGDVTGNASLENMARFQFNGKLDRFDIGTLVREFSPRSLPYDGVISGSVGAGGNIHAPGASGIQANMDLAIAPGSRGVPVSGRLNADYDGPSGLVKVSDSYIALPNTRLDLSGSLDRQLQIKFVSRNLKDLQPALAMASKNPPAQLPIQLRNGSADFTGAVTGKLSSPAIAGHIQVVNFQVEGRPFDHFAADVAASSSGAQVKNGLLVRDGAQVQLAASVGLRRWSPLPSEPLSASANIRNADFADLLALAGEKNIPISGNLNASAQIMGTVGNPLGNANLTAANGAIDGQPYDRIAVNVDFADRVVRLTNAQLTAGNAQADLTGTFRHPSGSFETGTLQVHLASTPIAIAQLRVLQKARPGLDGALQADADAGANLQKVNGKTELLLTSVNGSAGVRGLRLEGKNLGDLTASAQTAGSKVNYQVNSNFAGSLIRVNGQTQLARDYPTTARASISNLPIEQVLTVAGQTGIAAKGNLSANAQVSGTIFNPQANAEVDLTRAALNGQPLDSLQARVSYSNQLVEIPSLTIVSGPSHVDFNASFQHPQGDFMDGQVRFHLASNPIDLRRLELLQRQRPGLAGTLQLNADGNANLRKPAQSSGVPEILFTSLNANTALHGLQINDKTLGDLTASAETRGAGLAFNLNSNLGGAVIQGDGQAQLRNDYPVTARLTFSNLTYAGLQPLLSSGTTTVLPAFAAIADGEIQVSGSALKLRELGGSARITKFHLTAQTQNEPGGKQIELQNQGPIAIALARQTLNVQSAHITGASTDIKVSGSAPLTGKGPIALKVDATTNLAIAQDFDQDIYSSGSVVVDATIRGTLPQPLVNGQLRLANASFNMASLPNGISNANGIILFNGNNAVIQNLTAESGGGKVTVGGFGGLTAGGLRYGLTAKADMVRVRTPQGASVVASAAVNLTGTSMRSVLGGTVTIERIAFNPHSDFGSFLSSSATPPQASEAATGPLAGMKLDIRIRTAPDVAVQSSLAQSIQATADLTLRGTITEPGMVGRVTATSGKLVFFGNTYNINAGTVSFFDPLSIDPILNVDLETQTQGVDVTINVSGPINNMKLTYRSDPPLQFNEIVALLATGRTPTSDPNIVVNQPAAPQQSLQQMGESAIVGQAIANPLANRLSRVFGISQLKIDPMFTGGSILPQARVTLQQQVASNVTFTYVTDLSQPNAEIFRVEWNVNPRWSAVVLRDENGEFGIDFFYKRQFR